MAFDFGFVLVCELAVALDLLVCELAVALGLALGVAAGVEGLALAVAVFALRIFLGAIAAKTPKLFKSYQNCSNKNNSRAFKAMF